MRLSRAPHPIRPRAIGQYAVFPTYSTSLGCNCGSGLGDDPPPPVGIPNPSSVHCKEQGGHTRVVKGPDGEYGMCVFPDGSECEEWAFYNGKCKPGAKPAEASSSMPFVIAAALGLGLGAFLGSLK